MTFGTVLHFEKVEFLSSSNEEWSDRVDGKLARDRQTTHSVVLRILGWVTRAQNTQHRAMTMCRTGGPSEK